MAFVASLTTWYITGREDEPRRPVSVSDDCPAIQKLAQERSAAATNAHTTYTAASATGGGREDAFGSAAVMAENARRQVAYEVGRYAAVVAQNPECFDAATRADAAALAASWDADAR